MDLPQVMVDESGNPIFQPDCFFSIDFSTEELHARRSRRGDRRITSVLDTYDFGMID